MTRIEFLRELSSGLLGLTEPERISVIADMEEHFDAAAAKGKSEQETCDSLGSPRTIASGYMTQSLVRRAEETTSVGARLVAISRAVMVGVSLSVLNFFVFFIPFLIGLALLVAFWCMAAVPGMVGVALIMAAFGHFGTSLWIPATFACAGVGGIATTGGLGSLAYAVTWLVLRVVLSYLKLNLAIIKA